MSAAKVTHEEELAKYNASILNHVPLEGTSKAARKEVEPVEKPEKKIATVSCLSALRIHILNRGHRNQRNLHLNQL